MASPFSGRTRLLVVGLLVCLSGAANAATTSQLRNRGKTLLQENCGSCHAVGAVGGSALKAATPMRNVYAKFAPRELQAELREGMVSRHREMPQIDFSDEDVDAILAYLYALSLRK